MFVWFAGAEGQFYDLFEICIQYPAETLGHVRVKLFIVRHQHPVIANVAANTVCVSEFLIYVPRQDNQPRAYCILDLMY